MKQIAWGNKPVWGLFSAAAGEKEDRTESARLSLTYNLQKYKIAPPPPESESESTRKSVLETVQFPTEVHIFYTIE